MQIKEVMTKEVEMLELDSKIIDAAKKMKELNTGAIPVSDGERIQGLLTDRDIVVRCIAAGKKPEECEAQDVMTSPIQYIFEDQELKDAAERMKLKQCRRLVVLNRQKKLVGIVSLGDIASMADGEDIALPADIVKSTSVKGSGSSKSASNSGSRSAA